MKRVLITTLLLPLLLGGCPPMPVTLKTITLRPSLDESGEQSWFFNSFCAGVAPFETGRYHRHPQERSMSASRMSMPGGLNPSRVSGRTIFYRGHITFDLSQFDAITDATLLFGLVSSQSTSLAPSAGPGVIMQDNPPQSYATTVGMSTGTKNEGQGPDHWDFDNPVSLPACTSMMFTPCSLDVSAQVRICRSGTHPKYGFIVAGPVMDFPSSLPHDNNANISCNGGIQLQMSVESGTQPPCAAIMSAYPWGRPEPA